MACEAREHSPASPSRLDESSKTASLHSHGVSLGGLPPPPHHPSTAITPTSIPPRCMHLVLLSQRGVVHMLHLDREEMIHHKDDAITKTCLHHHTMDRKWTLLPARHTLIGSM